MKTKQAKSLEAMLLKISSNLNLLTHPTSRAEVLKDVNDLIGSLTRLRSELNNPAIQKQAADVREPLSDVIKFLEFARGNDVLNALIALPQEPRKRKPKRTPVEIPANLSNQQIRALLEKDLSRSELAAIAAQRAISVGKSTTEQIKKDILRNLERQEGYGRLASS
jgi:hypothetical protein